MTPLAHRVARDMIQPRSARQLSGDAAEWVRSAMLDAHFFDVADIVPLAHDLIRECGGLAEALADLSFLPAPVTWLEFRQADGARGAFVLTQSGENEACVVVVSGASGNFSAHPLGMMPTNQITASESGLPTVGIIPGWPADTAERMLMTVYGILNLINRPGGLPRREHAVHRGMARDMTKRGLVGKFPLRGWTEIQLCVGPKGNEREPKDAFATAEKCLHFVRAHRRRCWGVWRQIPAHWKGDPALGIKQTRYSVVPPRRAA